MAEINIEQIMEEIRAEAKQHALEPLPTFVETAAPNTGENAFPADQADLNKQIRKEITLLLNPDEKHYYGVTDNGLKGKIRKLLRKVSNGSVAPLRVHTGVTLDTMMKVLTKLQSENVLLAASLNQINIRLDEERESRIELQRRVSELEKALRQVSDYETEQESQATGE